MEESIEKLSKVLELNFSITEMQQILKNITQTEIEFCNLNKNNQDI